MRAWPLVGRAVLNFRVAKKAGDADSAAAQ